MRTLVRYWYKRICGRTCWYEWV